MNPIDKLIEVRAGVAGSSNGEYVAGARNSLLWAKYEVGSCKKCKHSYKTVPGQSTMSCDFRTYALDGNGYCEKYERG